MISPNFGNHFPPGVTQSMVGGSHGPGDPDVERCVVCALKLTDEERDVHTDRCEACVIEEELELERMRQAGPKLYMALRNALPALIKNCFSDSHGTTILEAAQSALKLAEEGDSQ